MTKKTDIKGPPIRVGGPFDQKSSANSNCRLSKWLWKTISSQEHSVFLAKAMTSAINPIMMLIVGAVVDVLVMSIYGPIISVSSSLG